MNLLQEIECLRPDFVLAAQDVLDNWIQDDGGFSEQYGYGGVCDYIAKEITNHPRESPALQPGDESRT